MPNKQVSPAEEDYLKAVFHLQGEAGRVNTTDIARHLGYRKPSVSAMLKRLGEEGLLDYSPRQGVRLSRKGLRATLRVVRRHRLLETFLVKVLGLDWSEVHEEAEVLEHHLSRRMVDAIDRVLGHPQFDPHGHPIPDSNGLFWVRDLVALGELPPGAHGTVREVRSDDSARLQKWKELGLVPGAALEMKEKQDFEDVMHIAVGARTIVTGSEGVDGVFVEVE